MAKTPGGFGAVVAAAASVFAAAVAMTPFGLADALSGEAPAICVENASQDTLLFVAEVDGGARIVRMLNPGASLCAAASQEGIKGTVGVFESEDALEGCSRLAVAGTPERLIAYASFDNCTWAPN